MKKWVKYSNLSHKDKVFRIINLSVMLVIFLSSIAFAIYHGVTGNTSGRLLPSILVAGAAILPLLFELVFRTRFNNVIFLGLELYLLVSGFLGSVLNFYDRISWFDVLIHCIMGYLVAMVALFFIARLGDYKKLSVWQIAVFCLCFSLAIELLWELCEWTLDNLSSSSYAQGVPVVGNAPLVTDTMEDLLCNLSGALLFFVHFVVGKKSLPLGINAIERELTENKIVDLPQTEESFQDVQDENQQNKTKTTTKKQKKE